MLFKQLSPVSTVLVTVLQQGPDPEWQLKALSCSICSALSHQVATVVGVQGWTVKLLVAPSERLFHKVYSSSHGGARH